MIELVDLTAGVEQCNSLEPLFSVVVEPESDPGRQGQDITLPELADLLVTVHEASAALIVFALWHLGLEGLGAPGDHGSEQPLSSDDVEELRCIVVVGQQEASGLDEIPDGGDSGALELLVVAVPELGPAGLGVEAEGGLLGGESLNPAVGAGAEAVLLRVLKHRVLLLLLVGDQSGGGIEESSAEEG